MKESNSKKLDKQYDLLVTVDKKVAVVEEHLKNINGKILELDATCKIQDGRILWLEQKLWLAIGGGIVIIGILNFIGVV